MTTLYLLTGLNALLTLVTGIFVRWFLRAVDREIESNARLSALLREEMLSRGAHLRLVRDDEDGGAA